MDHGPSLCFSSSILSLPGTSSSAVGLRSFSLWPTWPILAFERHVPPLSLTQLPDLKFGPTLLIFIVIDPKYVSPFLITLFLVVRSKLAYLTCRKLRTSPCHNYSPSLSSLASNLAQPTKFCFLWPFSMFFSWLHFLSYCSKLTPPYLSKPRAGTLLPLTTSQSFFASALAQPGQFSFSLTSGTCFSFLDSCSSHADQVRPFYFACLPLRSPSIYIPLPCLKIKLLKPSFVFLCPRCVSLHSSTPPLLSLTISGAHSLSKLMSTARPWNWSKRTHFLFSFALVCVVLHFHFEAKEVSTQVNCPLPVLFYQSSSLSFPISITGSLFHSHSILILLPISLPCPIFGPSLSQGSYLSSPPSLYVIYPVFLPFGSRIIATVGPSLAHHPSPFRRGNRMTHPTPTHSTMVRQNKPAK